MTGIPGPVQQSAQRLRNLVQAQPKAQTWFRVVRNDAGGPTRVDIYDEIGGGSWLGGGVSAVDFAAELAAIPGDLEVHLNSPGGDVFDGLAIYNALAQRPGKVTTVIDGLAASAASFIAQAGKTRVIAPGAMVMIHDASGMCMGNAANMREVADLLDKVSDNLAGIYAAHTGRAGGWRDAMQKETWYTADEAVAAGLADRVAARPEEGALAAASRFDLSAFAHAPRIQPAVAQQGAAGSPRAGESEAGMPAVVGKKDKGDGDGGGGYMPQPYHRDADETVQCPTCEKYNAPDAGWCDQCGAKLTGRDDVMASLPAAAKPAKGKRKVRSAADFDDSPWDAAKAWHNGATSDDPAAFYKAICAGRRDGDPSKQSSWALPYKYTPSSPPNAAGVRNALARLSSTEGLTNKEQARKLLEGLMKKINPDYESSSTDAAPAWLRETPAPLPAWL